MDLRAKVKDFIYHDVDPIACDIEEKDEIPQHIIEACRDLGLFGLSIPKRYGGLGLGMEEKVGIYEEVGKTINGFTTFMGAHTGIGSVGIVEMGSEEQKQKYLPRMASGELIGAFALTEREAGSNASSLKTTAVRKGDRYILNGSKIYVTNGTVGDVFTVMAVTDPDLEAKGITSFIVEKSFPGFQVGKKESKMGLRGSQTCELFFENCEVPVENVLGEEGKGYINALTILTNGRAGLAARNLGSAIKLLELSMDYAMTRIQFEQPIFEQQIIQHYLAEMAVDIETLRSMTYRVARMVDDRKNVIKEAAMVKLLGSEVYGRVADKALQIFGGKGYMKEFPIERYYRDARVARIYEGTSEIQKNIIAARLKREYNGQKG